MGAPLAHCTCNATISVSGRGRNTYFMIFGASVLFDNRFAMLLVH